jgi:predicted negative regulator of RcsB-dependent stress response|tara:strand:- start:1779 stop:2549 length:771 start_codon:yes stop_codon:yes gene_type:complete
VALDTSEEEQVEKIQTFFRQNGWFLAIGLVFVLGGNFGYRSWEDQKRSAADAASDAFSTFQTAARESAADADQRSAAISLGDAFMADHSDTNYAVLAGLQVAKLHFGSGKLSEAESALRTIKGSASEQLLPLVQIRLARLLGAQDRPEEGLTLLAEPMQWAGFTAARHEAEGDLLYQLDRLDEARQAYQLAVNTAGEDGLPGLTMKVEDLTFAAAAVDQADLDESISDDQPAAVQDAASVDAAEADAMPADTKDNG